MCRLYYLNVVKPTGLRTDHLKDGSLDLQIARQRKYSLDEGFHQIYFLYLLEKLCFFFFLLILQFYLKSCLIYGKFEILGKPNLIFFLFKLYGTSIIAVISDCIFILMRFLS